MKNIPDALMAQAEIRTVNGRTRKVIPIVNMKYTEVMAMLDVPKTTARDAVRRGYYVVNYTKKTVTPGVLNDVDGAYRLARWWYYKKLHGLTPWWAEAEDMIQEAVARLLELSGDPRMGRRSFRVNVIKTVMSDYLRSNRKHGNKDQEEIGSRRQWTEWRLKDGCVPCKESAPTWRRKHSATNVMCDIIEARGITPLTVQV
jgi:hypothetical protein